MLPISNLTAISDEIILLELIPDQSNIPEDPSDHKFTWTVKSYNERNMKIKVIFNKHEYISAGVERDIFKATIL